MAPTQQNPRSMAFIPTSCASDYMIVATAILAVTFMATEVYRRNDFLFGDTDLTPSFTSMSPGVRAGRSIIEKSSLFPDGAYPSSSRSNGNLPIFDAMKKSEEKLKSGKAAHIGHPCTRFVSAFEHMSSESAEADKVEWAEEHIGSMSIDEFAIELKSNPELHYENLFRPMSESFFSEDGVFQYDEVMCQESTSVILQRISSLKGKPSPKVFLDTPLLASAHDSCEDLSDETKEVINKLYKRDFCIFGYDELPSETPVCSQARMTKDALTQRYADCVAAEEQSSESELIVHVWKS
jgi:hypothetical protein